MLSSDYSKRLFGRTRGRSKKKFDLKKYYQTVNKYKFQKFDNQNYITSIWFVSLFVKPPTEPSGR